MLKLFKKGLWFGPFFHFEFFFHPSMLIIHKTKWTQSKKEWFFHKGDKKVAILSWRAVYCTTFISNDNKNQNLSWNCLTTDLREKEFHTMFITNAHFTFVRCWFHLELSLLIEKKLFFFNLSPLPFVHISIISPYFCKKK